VKSDSVRGTAVVTGGAGFIGRRLVQSLLDEGRHVRVVDRRPGAPDGCEHLLADLAEDELTEALRGDVVFHLAGHPGVRGDGVETERKRLHDNVIATERVVGATPKDVPLVFTSSSSVYGGSLGRPCHEDDPLAPRGGYAWSKITAERICRARALAGGLVHTARLFTVVGEGQRPDMALAMWAAAVAGGRPVTVYGNLDRSRDFTDVAQVVAVLIKLSVAPRPTVVNVGTGVGQTVGALLDAIGRQVGRQPQVRLVDAPHQDPYATLADTTRLQSLTRRALRTDLGDVVGRYLADDNSPIRNLIEGQLT